MIVRRGRAREEMNALSFFYDSSLSFMNGINWFGMETASQCLGGLWKNSVEWYVEGLRSQGWDAIRVPLSAKSVLENPVLPETCYAGDGILMQFWNPLTYHNLLLYLFTVCEGKDIKLLLDVHRILPGQSTPLWYIPGDPQWTFYRLWEVYDRLLSDARYFDSVAFLGIDLFNEPHGEATFGTNDPLTDWRLFSQETIRYLVDRYDKEKEEEGESGSPSPSFLIFINGIDWGKNFSGYADHPYDVGDNDNYYVSGKNDVASLLLSHVQWSPHLYGPSLNTIASFDPRVLYSYWDELFGTVFPPSHIWIGEWGGRFDNPDDLRWMTLFREYMNRDRRFRGQFFWALNPDSQDVDGILDSEWSMWNHTRIQFILHSS